MKTRFPILSVRRATVLAVVAGSIFGIGQEAKAGPQGERVVRGQAAFQRNGGLTTITAANNTIINYKSFNIGSNEAVQFVQPGANSRVLNRIGSTSPTKIDGGLTANGQVYLVNPSGIVFGKNSVVNVNGLYAAAGRISDKDFLKGVNHFTNVTGPVINQGMLSGANVTLVGRSIQNQGQIIADGGIVTTVVGNDVLIREGNGQIFVKIDGRNLNTAAGPSSGSATAPKLGNAAIDNTGTISAAHGIVTLAAGDALSLAVHNSGTVDASGGQVTVASRSGTIVNDGTITASVDSGHAGSVIVQAPRLVNNGTVSSNADSGSAGYVEFTSSRQTLLNNGSLISASGGQGVADGGHILIHSYSGDTTLAAGATVDISGGKLGGDGGLGELSGKHLSVQGTIKGDVAPGAKAASMLFDPFDLVIGTAADDDIELNDGTISSGDGGSATFNVSTGAVEAFAGDVRMEAQNNITINANINKTNGGLTLIAGNDIQFGFPGAPTTFGAGGPLPLTIKANFLDFEAHHSITDNILAGTGLTSLVGNITLTATTGRMLAGLVTVPDGQTLTLTQAESMDLSTGPFGVLGNPANTNLVVRITAGTLTMGGEAGGTSGVGSLKSLDAQASDLLRIEDTLTIGTTCVLACDKDIQIAGGIHATGGVTSSVDIHAATSGTGTLSFDSPGVEIWGATIALRSGSNGGLGVASIDALTNAPIFRDSAGGATRPPTFTFQQDAPVTSAVLPATTQFGASMSGISYRVESSDASVSITDGPYFDNARLTIASETGLFTYIRLNPNTIDVTGPAQLGGNVISTGTQHYRGALWLMQDRTLSSSQAVTVDSTVDSGALPGGPDQGTGDVALTVRGVAFIDNGPLGSLARLKSLDVTGISILNGQTITTAGNQTFEGTVNLAKDTTLISQADGVISFLAAVDGLHNLTVQTTTNGLISFGGDVGAHGRLLCLNLSTDGGATDPRSIPDAATIIGTGPITLHVGDLVMGQNEKFTTLGNLVIDATGNVTLGDLTTSGDMTVTGAAITLLRRPAGTLLNSAGESVPDGGVDYVAGGNIVFNGPITLGGVVTAPAPTFADVDGTSASASLAGFEFQTSIPADVTVEGLTLNDTTILDGRVIPPPPIPPPQPPEPPPPPPPPQLEFDTHELAGVTNGVQFGQAAQQPRAYSVSTLSRVGVASRGVNPDEARTLLMGGTLLYSDMPSSVDRYVDNRIFVATRANPDGVERLAKAYDSVLGGEGQPQALSKTLGAAADRYLAQASTMDPAAFRKYIETTPSEKDTLLAIQKLEAVLADAKKLGLPAIEYRQARARMLAGLASPHLTVDQLARTVEKTEGT